MTKTINKAKKLAKQISATSNKIRRTRRENNYKRIININSMTRELI
jgi:hypothetical protein